MDAREARTSSPQAIADPSVSWDSFGNLFLSYLGKATNNPQVLDISTNGGTTFTHLASVASQIDQPTVTTGPSGTPGTGSVWVSWSGFGGMFVAGAPVTGPGAVGKFGPTQAIAGSTGLSFGDIAVGPTGAVMTSFGPASGTTGGTIYTSTSSGLGQPFTEAQVATATGVGGFEPIPAQPSRGIDSESGLAYDGTGGPHRGRVYLMYTDASPAGAANTDIYVRYSDSNGAGWSSPVRVNDDIGTSSQFLPRIALDPTSGELAVSWYDTRNDPLNVNTELYGAFSTGGGASFTPNVKISAGASSESGADPPPAGYPDPRLRRLHGQQLPRRQAVPDLDRQLQLDGRQPRWDPDGVRHLHGSRPSPDRHQPSDGRDRDGNGGDEDRGDTKRNS